MVKNGARGFLYCVEGTMIFVNAGVMTYLTYLCFDAANSNPSAENDQALTALCSMWSGFLLQDFTKSQYARFFTKYHKSDDETNKSHQISNMDNVADRSDDEDLDAENDAGNKTQITYN
ncbi:MAG: hypothetical protein GY782_02855 [Gammaproteobacteria bacterium]|nr:hypothetical protein [Gammaproteobacteria bacterium]